MKSEDFEKVKIIGRGAFGEVQLVRTGHDSRFQVLLVWVEVHVALKRVFYFHLGPP